jgi:hypothetical protein
MTWRWVMFVVALALYGTRVFLINGWYIVTYGLGIYLLNQFIGFLSPQVQHKHKYTQALVSLGQGREEWSAGPPSIGRVDSLEVLVSWSCLTDGPRIGRPSAAHE